jgi:hypothetical protein
MAIGCFFCLWSPVSASSRSHTMEEVPIVESRAFWCKWRWEKLGAWLSSTTVGLKYSQYNDCVR